MSSQAPPPLPPRRHHDKTSSTPFTRSPHKLTAYLIPFPKPNLPGVPPETIPDRYLLYTPPHPQLIRPPLGAKEPIAQKLQRKFQHHLREAKTSAPEKGSWRSIRGKITRGVDWGISQTQSSNLDFLNRIPRNKKSQEPLQELLILHPPSVLPTYHLRTAFLDTLHRARRKAQRSAVLATGLLPFTMVVVIFVPVPGPIEVNTAWSYFSLRGARTARSVSKQLHDDKGMQLSFKESEGLRVLERYLYARCHEVDPNLWPRYDGCPSEGQVLDGLGWKPPVRGVEGDGLKGWEDELWEIEVAKDDLKRVCKKGAKEWEKWIETFERKPKKAARR